MVDENFENNTSKIENKIVQNQLKELWRYADPDWVVTEEVKERERAILRGLAFQLSA